MDLSKLTPAPWGDDWHSIEGCCSETDSAFIALARNAFDVMMRRGWVAERFSLLGGGFTWRITMEQANDMIRQHGAGAAEFKRFASLSKWPDPFTALVEADKWYRENVEAK